LPTFRGIDGRLGVGEEGDGDATVKVADVVHEGGVKGGDDDDEEAAVSVVSL
jgi:hypothetical protein